MNTRALRVLMLLLVLAGLVVWRAGCGRRWGVTAEKRREERAVEEVAKRYLALEDSEARLEATTWAPARQAFEHEDVVLAAWSALTAGEDPGVVLGAWPWVGPVATATDGESLGHGVIHWRLEGTPAGGAPRPAGPWISEWILKGWRMVRSQWRQVRFEPGLPSRSEVEVRLSMERPMERERARVRARIEIEWWRPGGIGEAPAPARVRLLDGEVWVRQGEPWFREVASVELTPRRGGEFVDPLLAVDLGGDGRPDLVLPGAGRLLMNRSTPGVIAFESASLDPLPGEVMFAGLAVDWTGDGLEDLLLLGGQGLWMQPGQNGRFGGSPGLIWEAPDRLRHPQALTLGDVDGDGRVDVYAAQYKLPYQKGQFPTPYYDAVDGFPSYLLRSAGGRLEDGTDAAGLGGKRRRRTYTASLVDWDGDRDMDLVTVSDFAGVDVHLNDGRGRFQDVSGALGDLRHFFGMAHTFGDWNGDGRLDLYVVGMDSPTASVLDGLGLSRGARGEERFRALMTAGNRVFLGRAGGGMELASWSDQVARAGWAWGVVTFEPWNDGRHAFYLANGHESLPNPTDYERQFWVHDLSVGHSTNDPVAELYYRSAAGRRRAAAMSYGGWQENVLFADAGAGGYVDLAFLAGLGLPEDSRNLICEDFDGDGRMDLALTTFELWPQRRQRLLVFRNEVTEAGHWIGFQFLPGPGVPPWTGGRIEIETAMGRRVAWMTTGNSFRAQQSPRAHFGLGGGAGVAVRSARVVWPDGTNQSLPVEPDRWHRVARRSLVAP